MPSSYVIVARLAVCRLGGVAPRRKKSIVNTRMVNKFSDGARRSREATGCFFYLQSELVKFVSADVRSQDGLPS